MEKYDKIDPVRWHMIGHLQTNKVKYIIDKVDLIHSVDSMRLAEEINKRAGQHDKIIDILVQVSPAMEESKFGVATKDAKNLIDNILENCPNIRIKGLMCMAPFEDNPKDTTIYFAKVKRLYDEYIEVKHGRLDFSILSMGMSHDFEVAINEGSNLIRIGTAIFGERSAKN
jgi:pyridoxal phosphate enzyme (YggS family)